METLAIYPDTMNKATKYALMSAAGEKLQNYAGQTINVTAYVLYENTDVKTGEVIETLGMLIDDERVTGTISQSFIREFKRIIECWKDEPLPPIAVKTGRSNKGRDYLTCGVDIKPQR